MEIRGRGKTNGTQLGPMWGPSGTQVGHPRSLLDFVEKLFRHEMACESSSRAENWSIRLQIAFCVFLAHLEPLFSETKNMIFQSRGSFFRGSVTEAKKSARPRDNASWNAMKAAPRRRNRQNGKEGEYIAGICIFFRHAGIKTDTFVCLVSLPRIQWRLRQIRVDGNNPQG